MKMFQILKLGLMLIVLVGTIACSSPSVTSNPPLPATPAPSVAVTSPAAPSEVWMQRVKVKLTQELGVPSAQIQLKEVTTMEWGDACLGLPQPDELCAQVITSGYQARFGTPQGDYRVHSDRTGNTIRIAAAS